MAIPAGPDDRTQALFQETLRRFVERECTRDVVRRLESDPLGYAPEHWRRMADLGWLGLLAPDDEAERAVGLVLLAHVIEALGAAALPSPLFATVVEAGSLIATAGDAEQRRHWLPAIAAGRALLAAAVQEPGPELAAEHVRTQARATPDGFALSGTKLFVPYAHVAEVLICLARTGDAPEALTLFLVPRAATGLRLTRLRTTTGEPQFAVEFDGVAVPRTALLGPLHGAWPHILGTLDRVAALRSAELVGLGQRALDLTLAFVRERVQFDRPIGSFQAVHHHCADMYRDIEQVRVLTAQAIARLAQGRPACREVSLAKVKASETIPRVLSMAHQLHGGVGFYTDYPLEMLYRRVMAAQVAGGSAMWHRRRLGHLLATDSTRFRREGAHSLACGGP